ncbi:ABC transporter permease [Bradyrhizobium sp. U87765 SZCCT0131]|uniref:ABC transporter permease n=1 Tax=unclassified Bradyrhizobium TaxID=2631580 RepID=UPI001BAA8716|nr:MULTISPECIES: ABC transporter permease [unclassified Bradyrhizobium]MBR1221615.1 ABC transporter permease [Bradyrhizobium sp. U87765 SZCCT0131]MBR1264462.1 ABC transporter permease [Bradyrhizobium sp. U87765 SZCCT0134]MBR1304631.1 ABC transporter permease [Bradyrhizobium sp. U87765 SZCCT0110]MBR1322512.1 ABC transporter permease [Bradyrhizobium sp. U87765 SZCCT0109]MBR1346560.1 ABC transporter permease [Bradyrhizobium sp. U87765 SZCCT0048]
MRETVIALPANPLQRIPGVAVMLVLLVVLFGLIAPGFLSVPNISNVLVQSTILLMLALPMTLIIMTEGLDLSMGAVLTLTSLVVAIVAVATKSVVLALGAAVLVGVGFGIANGWLVAFVGIPPFVATLGTLGMAQGLSLIVSDGQSVVGIPAGLRGVYSGEVAGIPAPILLALGTYLAFHGLLYHTRFGTYIFALGGNREALRYAGRSPGLLLVGVYAIGGAMAGLAGLLMTARMNSGHPTAGLGLEFDAIAAVAVGGTSFERGNGWLLGTVLGVIAVGVLRNGLNLLALPSSVQVASVGILVIVALFVDGLRSQS